MLIAETIAKSRSVIAKLSKTYLFKFSKAILHFNELQGSTEILEIDHKHCPGNGWSTYANMYLE